MLGTFALNGRVAASESMSVDLIMGADAAI